MNLFKVFTLIALLIFSANTYAGSDSLFLRAMVRPTNQIQVVNSLSTFNVSSMQYSKNFKHPMKVSISSNEGKSVKQYKIGAKVSQFKLPLNEAQGKHILVTFIPQ